MTVMKAVMGSEWGGLGARSWPMGVRGPWAAMGEDKTGFREVGVDLR